MTGQGTQQRCSLKSRYSIYVHTFTSTSSTLAGHVHRMDDGRIPKVPLYGKLANGARCKGRPQLRFKDVYASVT